MDASERKLTAIKRKLEVTGVSPPDAAVEKLTVINIVNKIDVAHYLHKQLKTRD